MAFDPADRPDQVTIPIADLLGPDGHDCTGWRLEAVDGSIEAARDTETPGSRKETQSDAE